jgi:tetratricopeptide (TPR) repeat protein
MKLPAALLLLAACALPAQDPGARAERLWKLERYQEANDEFRTAVERNPKDATLRVRWGRFFLERFNKAEAAKLFEEALELDPGNAGALLGLALIASDGFEAKAVELAEKACAADPKLVEARELLARLALEDGNTAKAAAEADKALAISRNALDAMAIRATIDWLAGRDSSPWMDRILKIDPSYGKAYATAGRFFVLNRRYEEGIGFYRKAVALQPRLWSAHAELGLNLMRLAQDDEARRHLIIAYENNYRDYATVNSLRLLDSYKNFVFFRSGETILKLDRKEAEPLRPYFEDEVKRAMYAYEQKYGFKLERPVQVEVYPNHEDFAVRTLGMPGLGALGVTFGYVVAMDSPSSRKPGSYHWAGTLRHEMSHVYVLAATRNMVPRWFTEGVAVHEETAASADWGDRLDPVVIAAIRDRKLLPVSQLDRGFTRPTDPSQIAVSYFQAGRLCDFISKTWGEKKLVEMIHAFAESKSTPDAIRQALGIEPEELDKRFFAAVEAETKKTVQGFNDWQKGMRRLAEAAKAGDSGAIIAEAPAVRDLFPEFVEPGCAYELLVSAYIAKGDKAAAATELTRYSKAGGRDPASIKQLAALLDEEGRKAEAAAALERLIYITPLDEELHTRLGELWLALGNATGAIREFTTVVALKPLDQASSRYNLARAYRAAGQTDRALDEVLLALEAAPGYRPAQKMLLELKQ